MKNHHDQTRVFGSGNSLFPEYSSPVAAVLEGLQSASRSRARRRLGAAPDLRMPGGGSASRLGEKAMGIAMLLALADPAHAQSGTWTNTASGGLWSATSNWSGGTVADGSGNTADFNNLNITADNTVQLDSARIIGNLTFGDTVTGSAAGWTLANNGNPANILTLAGGSTITVNALGTGKTATISAILAGGAGLSKAGNGTLTLTGNNTFTGQLNVANTASTVILGAVGGSAAGGATSVFLGGGNYNGGGTLQLAQSNQIKDTTVVTMQAGHYSGHAIFSIMGFSETIGGLVTQGSGNGGGASIVQNGLASTTGTLTLDVATGQTYSATRWNGNTGKNVIQDGAGKLAIVKSGLGTQIFGVGSFTYSGGTTVNGGTLQIGDGGNASGTLGSGAVVLNSGGTLAFARPDASLSRPFHKYTNII